VALDSTASAHWEGDLMSGQGTTTLTSGAGGPFAVDWKARSEEHDGKKAPPPSPPVQVARSRWIGRLVLKNMTARPALRN